MTTMVFHPSLDGYVAHLTSGDTWANVRDGVGTTSLDLSSIILASRIRSDSTADEWERIDRSIVLFDTSAIPDGATIVSATLSVYGESKTENEFDPSGAINIYASAPASEDDLVAGDYDSLGTTPLCDTAIAQGDFVVGGRNSFVLNAAGLALISKTGITKFGLREVNYDNADVEPTWNISAWTYFDIYAVESGFDDPTTDAATSVGNTTATLNGTVGSDYRGAILTINFTNGSDADPYICSFEYGLTVSYGDVAAVSGTFAGGESFSKAITGLIEGKVYHFRAKTVHGGETSYGSDRTFSVGLVRVTALAHYWSAGPNGVDQEEILTGGLFSEYFSPISAQKTPEPTIPDTIRREIPTYQPTLQDYGKWLVARTHEQQVAVFGEGDITYSRWRRWAINQLRMGRGIR